MPALLVVPFDMDPTQLAGRIKAHGLALGFDLLGISPVADPPHGEAFADWLRRAYHGEMAYLLRTAEQRRHPGHFLPWAQSVVSVAMNYAAPERRDDAPPGIRGWISRYAWGADYHEIMEEKLDRLLAAIREMAGPEVKGRAFVDAGSAMDRGLAVNAGIGWFGKNTNLLTMGAGSFVFLGELFLNLSLPPDRPIRDRCGSCRLCLDACPTHAFVGPYVLDARRCISYLTIELKGPIPRPLRPLLGTHIFGCDICQDVCPYNARLHGTREPAFHPRRELFAPELIPLLALTDAEFRTRFHGSPIRRTKRRGLLRNVCVALGNLRRPEAVPALAQALAGDPERLVRGHAAWALGQIGGSQALIALDAAAEAESDPWVREEVVLARQATVDLAVDDRGLQG